MVSSSKFFSISIYPTKYFSEVFLQWFDFNDMKTNSRKKHILFSRNDNVSANSDDNTTISENKNELVGIVLDSKIPFKDHIKNVSKEASQKLNA